MGDRAPNTDTGEPETSSDALLDELVRALARQVAERDYEILRNKTPQRAPPRRRQEGFKMSAAAIYARYSSDLQREASIEDQNRICRERAAREGWSVYKYYSDHGISGASLIRPGIQKLLQDALEGRFDIIVTESLDRLSRDQEDIAHIFKRISFAGGRIVTVSEGEINELHIGLKGTMGALYLKDLADKTRRGLRGRVEAGKSGGGNSYGYDVVRGVGPDGQPLTGERRINAQEAAIVRRIFEDYAAGVSPRAIAKRPERRGRARPVGRDVGAEHHPRQPPARHRHPQQRALYRQAGLEPPALREGPGNRQAGVPAQSGLRMDRSKCGGVADRRSGLCGSV